MCVCWCETASASSAAAVHPRLRLPSRIWSHGALSAGIPLQCLGLGLGKPLAQASCIDSSRLQLSRRPRSWTSSQPCLQPAEFQRTKESPDSSDEERGTRSDTRPTLRPERNKGGTCGAKRSGPGLWSNVEAWEHGVVTSRPTQHEHHPLLAADHRCKCLSMPPLPVSGSGPKQGAGMGSSSPAPPSLDLLKNLLPGSRTEP